jgi:hypothetical protein
MISTRLAVAGLSKQLPRGLSAGRGFVLILAPLQ